MPRTVSIASNVGPAVTITLRPGELLGREEREDAPAAAPRARACGPCRPRRTPGRRRRGRGSTTPSARSVRDVALRGGVVPHLDGSSPGATSSGQLRATQTLAVAGDLRRRPPRGVLVPRHDPLGRGRRLLPRHLHARPRHRRHDPGEPGRRRVRRAGRRRLLRAIPVGRRPLRGLLIARGQPPRPRTTTPRRTSTCATSRSTPPSWSAAGPGVAGAAGDARLLRGVHLGRRHAGGVHLRGPEPVRRGRRRRHRRVRARRARRRYHHPGPAAPPGRWGRPPTTTRSPRTSRRDGRLRGLPLGGGRPLRGGPGHALERLPPRRGAGPTGRRPLGSPRLGDAGGRTGAMRRGPRGDRGHAPPRRHPRHPSPRRHRRARRERPRWWGAGGTT